MNRRLLAILAILSTMGARKQPTPAPTDAIKPAPPPAPPPKRFGRLVIGAVLSTAAVCHPSTPQPQPTSQVRVHNTSGATNCQYTLVGLGITPAQSPTGVAEATFTTPQSLVNATSATADCQGFQKLTVAPASLASNDVSIGPLVPLAPPQPPVPALPPAPTRDQVKHARACFQGLYVTTKQLGTVPSFGGVENGMLTDPADRQSVYSAIKAAGCDATVLAVTCHYTEPGVQYPNQTACNNDWQADIPTIVARVAEAAAAHLITIYMQGADEIPFATVAQQVGPQMAALRGYAGGDLTQWISLGPGFDSIVPIANADPYPQSNQTLVDLLLADRAAIGPNGIINLELPAGWAFAGGGALSGAGWFNSAAGKTVNVYLQEFANVSPGNEPAPAITGGVYDADHADFAPVTAADLSPWQQVWQVAARTLLNYTAPPDEITSETCSKPTAPLVPVTGSPTGATMACVFADVAGPAPYAKGGDLNGDPFVFIGFEIGTWQFTHGQASVQQVMNACKYMSSVGYPVVSCPATEHSAVQGFDSSSASPFGGSMLGLELRRIFSAPSSFARQLRILYSPRSASLGRSSPELRVAGPLSLRPITRRNTHALAASSLSAPVLVQSHDRVRSVVGMALRALCDALVGRPALGNAIGSVVLLGAKEQVVRSHALPIVAAVQDAEAVRNVAEVNHPRRAMRTNVLALMARQHPVQQRSVTNGHSSASPQPTANFGLMDFRPKTFLEGGGREGHQPTLANSTYQHTHGQSTTQQVINAGKYLASVGYPVVWAPTSAAHVVPFAPRKAKKPAAHQLTAVQDKTEIEESARRKAA